MPEAMAKRLPAYPVPAVRIGRFAVDQSVQGQGLGEQMLVDSLSRIVGASDISAAFAVIVDAKEQSVGFYKKYGFIQSRNHPLTLFLPVKTITQVLDK
jgi:predicted GNAT family N-acyltransferase